MIISYPGDDPWCGLQMMALAGGGLGQVEDVMGVVGSVFGADVVGLYAHGSAVLGGLRRYSDVDVFGVVRRRTVVEERRALVEMLMEVSGGAGRRPVELTIVVQEDVRPWRYPPVCEFQYGEWLRESYERGWTPSPGASPDLALLITVVLMGNSPLAGPAPREVLDPVPRDDLTRALLAGVPELLDELVSDTRNVLLTLARIWMTLATGVITSKDAAAGWVLARLPAEHRAVLSHAEEVYLGQADEQWDGLLPQAQAYAAHVVAEIERLGGRPA